MFPPSVNHPAKVWRNQDTESEMTLQIWRNPTGGFWGGERWAKSGAFVTVYEVPVHPHSPIQARHSKKTDFPLWSKERNIPLSKTAYAGFVCMCAWTREFRWRLFTRKKPLSGCHLEIHLLISGALLKRKFINLRATQPCGEMCMFNVP